MHKPRWWFVLLTLSIASLLVCTACKTVRQTQIVSLEIDPNPVVRGGSVTIAWQAEGVGLKDGRPSCILQRSFDTGGGDHQRVDCIGSRTDAFDTSITDTYVIYRFNALRRSGESYRAWSIVLDILHVGVTMTPNTLTLEPLESHDFTATVTNTSDTSVTWAASCGSINGSGSTITYTAPASEGECEVTATSVADTDAHDTATVTVREGTVPGTRIVDLQLDTSTPATLDSGRWLRAEFTVETDAPDGFRVWLRPQADGAPPDHAWGIQGGYIYSPSPVVDGPVVRVQRGFAQSVGEHDLHVDGLWFYIVSPDHSEVLLDEVLPTSITYRSLASVSEPTLTPASGTVEQGTEVGVGFDFTLDRQRNVRVDLFPMAATYGDPCSWCDHVASTAQIFTGTSSGHYDGGFTVLDTVTGEPTVEYLSIDIFDTVLSISDSWAIYTARQPVSFQFTTPSSPSTTLTTHTVAPSVPADVCVAYGGSQAVEGCDQD